MKFLMISTALCLSMATSAFAESPMSGFIDYTVEKSDLMASEFIGMRVYNAEATSTLPEKRWWQLKQNGTISVRSTTW